MTEEPIACTLTPGDFKSRVGSIAALNRAALLDHQRDDLKLVLTYAIDARDKVLAMIEGERSCCAFLDFAVEESSETLTVTVIAPEAAREAAETVFEPFRSKSIGERDSSSECACCPDQTDGAPGDNADALGDKTTHKLVGATAALAATGALACGICCVLPFALPATVVALTGSTMAWFAGMHGLITLIAALAVLMAWGWVGYQSYRSKRRPARSTTLVMGFATVMLFAALNWPLLEPLAFRLIGK